MRELYGRSRSAFQRRAASLLPGALALAGLLCLTSPAAAQDLEAAADPLGEVSLFQELPTVTAASKFEQDSREAPASISIITREEIERFGYRTLGEALNAARGIFTSYDRNYTYVAVRGFTVPGDYNTRILLLVDGHRLNDNVADAAYVGTESALDMSVVDRVEIIRGAASSLYGTNAFYAVVNVITRNGRSLQGGEVQADAGTFNSYRARARVRRAGAERRGVHGGRRHLPLGWRRSLLPRVRCSRDQQRHGDRPRRRPVGQRVRQDRLSGMEPSGRAAGSPEGSAYRVVRHELRRPAAGDPGPARLRGRPLRPSLCGSLAVRRLAGVRPAPVSGHLSLRGHRPARPAERGLDHARGAVRPSARPEAQGRDRRRIPPQPPSGPGLYDEDPFQSYLDDQRSSSVWAVFIQDEFRLTPRLLLNAGLRHDSYETFGGTTNPRAALIYTLDSRTTLKALYGQAFRAPNLYELYSQDGGISQKPSLSLRPETIQSYELVAERQIARSFRGTVSLYHFDVDRLIRLTTDPDDGLLVFDNLSRVQSRGIELGAEGTSGPVSGRASYAFQHVRDAESDVAPVNSPSHVGRVGISVAMLGERARAGAEFRWLSARRTVAGGEVPAYGLVNLTLLARPGLGGLLFSGSVYNLLNREYADPGGEELAQEMVVQDGRVVRLGVRYQF